MALPGETEAGSAGTQPCRGIAWRAHRDDVAGRESRLLRSAQNHIGSVDPDALKIPARRAEYLLTESAPSPFHAEPEHNWDLVASSSYDFIYMPFLNGRAENRLRPDRRGHDVAPTQRRWGPQDLFALRIEGYSATW
jgi:hypothetical protein